MRPILLLQEQNLSKMPGYQVFQDTTSRSRSCIGVPEELSFVHLENYSSADTSSGLLRTEGDDIMVISAYMDSKHQKVDDQLIRSIEYAKEERLKCLICCDSNAWSTVWGSTRSNNRESLILDMLIEYDLTIANIGTSPTFVRTNVESIIDLTIVSNGLDTDDGLNIVDWKVEDADLHSDHRLITFRIDKKPVKMDPKLTRDIRTANWHKFRLLLKDKLSFSSKLLDHHRFRKRKQTSHQLHY